MTTVYWDETLAYTALKWAQNQTVALTEIGHDCRKCRCLLNEPTTKIGQNIYVCKGYDLNKDMDMWLSAVLKWSSEANEFTYGGSNRGNSNKSSN